MSQQFPPNRSVSEVHWRDLMAKEILPGSVKVETQAGAELRIALNDMSMPEGRVCHGFESYVIGCLEYPEYPVFLWPWIEMRQVGIPVDYRKQFVVWLCANCRQLERKARKTSWVKGVVAEVHRSPSHIRPLYDQNKTILLNVIAKIRETMADLYFKVRSAVLTYDVEVGTTESMGIILEGTIINIDSTQLRTLGLIHIQAFDDSMLS